MNTLKKPVDSQGYIYYRSRSQVTHYEGSHVKESKTKTFIFYLNNCWLPETLLWPGSTSTSGLGYNHRHRYWNQNIVSSLGFRTLLAVLNSNININIKNRTSLNASGATNTVVDVVLARFSSFLKLIQLHHNLAKVLSVSLQQLHCN